MADRARPEERLARLEETLFFQERLLQELNEVLTAQGKQLDRVEQDLARACLKIEALQQALEDSGGEDAGPPPHYAPHE